MQPGDTRPEVRRTVHRAILLIELVRELVEDDVVAVVDVAGPGVGGDTQPLLAVEAEAAHGIARVLMNCAGIGGSQRTVGRDGVYPLAKFVRIINVNLIGSFNVLRLFAERLATAPPIGEERGVAINTASVAAYEGQIGQIAYSASKGGVVALSRELGVEFARRGVRSPCLQSWAVWPCRRQHSPCYRYTPGPRNAWSTPSR